MKTRILLLLFTAAVITSCSTKNEASDQNVPLGRDTNNASVNIKKSTLTDGPYVEKFPDGQIRIEGQIKNGTRFGQWTAYYPDGTKQSENYFEDGKKNGKTATFYKSGRLRYIGYFSWDKPSGMWE